MRVRAIQAMMLVLLCLPCWARLGDTVAQAEKRYGHVDNRVRRQRGAILTVGYAVGNPVYSGHYFPGALHPVMYPDGDYLITCVFVNGVCHGITYVKNSDGDVDQVMILTWLKANLPAGAVWGAGSLHEAEAVGQPRALGKVMEWHRDDAVAHYIPAIKTMLIVTKTLSDAYAVEEKRVRSGF